MRVDKKKNVSKVAKELLKNPLSTEREIEEKTWVWKSTVNRIKQEMGQIGAKDTKIIHITDKDLLNIQEMQDLVTQKIRDPEEMKNTRIWELAQAMREATARYSLFRWTATDDKGWLNSLKDLSTLELLKLVDE